jgi:chromosome segregation ATPase
VERSSPDLDTSRAETDELRQDMKSLGRQIADLQQLLAERSQDLAAPHAETAKPPQDIGVLDPLAKEQPSNVAARRAYAAVVAEQNAVQDALRHEVADLQQQGADHSQILGAARGEVANLRQQIDAMDLQLQAALPRP